MENSRNEEFHKKEKEIAYSRTVKAGKRIYYLDVKRSKNEDLYLSLTESKKVQTGDVDNPNVSFEKHKIFLYKEDLSKFTEALIDVIRFMQEDELYSTEALSESLIDDEPPIKLDLDDFE